MASVELPMKNSCEHGYGGFFKCPKGCHSKGPVEDYEEMDKNIDYMFKRMEAHGIGLHHDQNQKRSS